MFSPKKNLLDSFFENTGWTDTVVTTLNTNTTISSYNTSTGGVILAYVYDTSPIGTTPANTTSGAFSAFRAGYVQSGAFHQNVQQQSSTGTQDSFSLANIPIGATNNLDATVFNEFGLSRCLINAKMFWHPSGYDWVFRIGAVTATGLPITIRHKFIPFPSGVPIRLFTCGSFGSAITAPDNTSINLTPLTVTQSLLPGFYVFNSTVNFNAEPTITKFQSATLNRIGGTINTYRFFTRSAAADTGNVYRSVTQTYIEPMTVSELVLNPISSATQPNYLSCMHIPHDGMNQLL